MTEKLEQPPLPSANRPPPADVLPDHIFIRMRKMLRESVGRLPTPLVLILIASLLAATLTGLGLKFAGGKPQDAFMPQRLAIDGTLPSLDAARLQGSWVYTVDNKVMALRLQDNVFEWVIKPSPDSFERIFARGNFRVVGNVLILGPRGDMGKPETNLEQGLIFHPLDLHNLNLNAQENGKLMVWQLPASERRRLDRDVLSLFPKDVSKPMTWVRMGP